MYVGDVKPFDWLQAEGPTTDINDLFNNKYENLFF